MSGSIASPYQHAVTSGPIVAFGPIAQGWGSWDWVGADVCRELGKSLTTFEFAAWDIPDADVVILVKHTPPPGWVEAVTRRSVLIYAPVDHYSAAAEIDADASLLRRCSRILIHCERLRRYFEPYAPVEYMDHHVKFVAPIRDEFRTEGEILWVGVRTNLPPLVDWVNAHPLPVPLRVLTNPEDPYLVPSPLDVGFRKGSDVAIERWTPENHIEHASKCRAFFDIKANDFRSRHKPPAKGIDAIASGLPLAIDLDSSTAEHLARMGFEACPPHESERWLSRGYLDETRRFGAVLRELLSPVRIGRRYKHLFECVP